MRKFGEWVGRHAHLVAFFKADSQEFLTQRAVDYVSYFYVVRLTNASVLIWTY